MRNRRSGMTKSALITGAAGFIGQHLVKLLNAHGWKVVGTYGESETDLRLRLPNVTFVKCDLREGQQVNRLFQRFKFTHVFHLAAQSLPTLSWKDPVSTFESNIMGSLHLFEVIRRIKRPPVVISACSGAEYGHVRSSAIPVTEGHPLRPLNAYGISKVC